MFEYVVYILMERMHDRKEERAPNPPTARIVSAII